MESELPKVLVPACGRPMVEYVLDALDAVGIEEIIVVVGFRADDVREALAHRPNVVFVLQDQQLGTGHAVKCCASTLHSHHGAVLVVTGDSPLAQVSSLNTLLNLYDQEMPACVMGTLDKDNPAGLGRIVRDEQGEFLGIVEEKDATQEQLEVTEVNMSTYVFDCQRLLPTLELVSNDNRQSEYYITDCPGLLKKGGFDVRALPVLQPCEALSVNNLSDLAVVETELRRQGWGN